MKIMINPLASSSAGNSIWLSDGITPLLLDAGISFKKLQKAIGFRVSQLKGVLISHSHADHCRALKDLLRAGVDCYMSRETQKALDVNSHRTQRLVALAEYPIGSWRMMPFKTVHDVDNFGFLLGSRGNGKVLYLTDTPYCKYKFTGLTHILIGCNYSKDLLDRNKGLNPEAKKHIIKGHMSLETLKEFLRANDRSQLREIWLLHLSDGNSDAERFKREIQELTGVPVYIAEK